MIICITKSQCELLIRTLQERMDNLARVLNCMDNGDIEYNKEQYDHDYLEYHKLQKVEEELSTEIEKWRDWRD